MVGKVHSLLLGLVGDLPVDDADETAHALVSWLLGTIVQQQIQPRTAEALWNEASKVLGSHTPASNTSPTR